MSMGNKGIGLIHQRAFLLWLLMARLLKDAYYYDPAQSLAPQIQVMLEFREG